MQLYTKINETIKPYLVTQMDKYLAKTREKINKNQQEKLKRQLRVMLNKKYTKNMPNSIVKVYQQNVKYLKIELNI